MTTPPFAGSLQYWLRKISLTDMTALPQWVFWVFGVVIMVVVLWKLTSGQLVGSMEFRWFTQFGQGTGKARVLIRRQGAEKSGLPTVQVQVRVTGMIQSCSYTPGEARALADMLEEAARKVDPR